MAPHAGRLALVSLLVQAGLLVPAQAASAAPPPNDLESAATKIEPIPFTETIDTTEATTDGPRLCRRSFRDRSVFYRFRPTSDVDVQFDTFGSDHETTLAIYTKRAGEVRLVRPGCERYTVAGWAAARVQARAGVKYFFMVGSRQGTGGQLTVNLSEVNEEPLDFTVEVTDPGTVDPATGIASISGTTTCSRAAEIGFEGILRQLIDGMWVARGYIYDSSPCLPTAPGAWTVEVDTDTGVAFAPGSALFRTFYEYGWDGWDYSEHDGADTTIELISTT
jgi:hypothetical protein